MAGRTSSVLVAAGVAGACAPAWAQTGPAGYRLEVASTITLRYCLPPCLCPYHENTGYLTGAFTLTRTAPDPLFEHYVITGFVGSAVVNGQTVSLSAYGSYRRGGEVAIMHQLILDALVGGAAWHFDSGLVGIDPQHPFPQIHITAETDIAGCRQDVIDLLAGPDSTVCYADCDNNTGAPRLTVNDFVCFQNKFAAGDPYANCDGSSEPPVLTVNDFICFQGRFAAGCS